MGLKSVELQVAIPRTQDAGKMQEQMNQRNMIQQHHTTEEQKLRDEQNRIKAAQIDAKEQGRISADDQDPSSKHSHTKREQEQSHQEQAKQERKAQHPYKGKHIDISL